MQVDNEGRQLKEEIDLLGPRSPSRRFPADIKERVVAWVRAKQAEGVPHGEIIEFLGIPWGSITKWMSRAGGPPARSASASGTTGAPGLRPVRVVTAQPARKASCFSLRTPRGFLVEGLDLENLVEILLRVR